MPFAPTWVDLESIISEISQKKKDKYHMILLTCGIKKKKKKKKKVPMNLYTKPAAGIAHQFSSKMYSKTMASVSPATPRWKAHHLSSRG